MKKLFVFFTLVLASLAVFSCDDDENASNCRPEDQACLAKCAKHTSCAKDDFECIMNACADSSYLDESEAQYGNCDENDQECIAPCIVHKCFASDTTEECLEKCIPSTKKDDNNTTPTQPPKSDHCLSSDSDCLARCIEKYNCNPTDALFGKCYDCISLF